jgi:hypothetical protein
MGKSPSAACVVYHLTRRGLDDLPQSYDTHCVRQAQPVVDINAGFCRWLSLRELNDIQQ